MDTEERDTAGNYVQQIPADGNCPECCRPNLTSSVICLECSANRTHGPYYYMLQLDGTFERTHTPYNEKLLGWYFF